MQTIPTELFTGLTAIIAAFEEGSATRAAAKLGVTTATALRRIEAAEDALGVRLFERLPTGLEATSALEALLPWAEQAMAAARGMLGEVASGLVPGVGVVRIASTPVVSTHIMAPAAAAFKEHHPDIVLELVGSSTIAHMERLEADIALRGFKPTAGDLVARKLMSFDLVVAGAPGYFDASAKLDALPWLTWARDMEELPEAHWLAHAVPDAHIALRAAELTTLLEAARVGVGVLLIPAPLAYAQGFEIIDACPPFEPSGALWMIAHRALRDISRVDKVWRWLIEYFEALAQMLPSDDSAS